jgi:serine/threonine-protein kinase
MLKKLLGTNLVQISLLTLVVLIGMLWPFYPLERLENAYFDIWAGRFNTGSHPQVAVVEIDDKSLHAIGAWPWPRSLVAEMVSRLSDAGAQTIGVMLLYSQEALNPGLEEIRNLREINQTKIQKSTNRSATIPDTEFTRAQKRLDHDRQLISSIRSSKNVVLPFRLLSPTTSVDGIDKLSGMLIINSLKSQKKNASVNRGYASLSEWLRQHSETGSLIYSIREPYKELAGKAGAIGHLNVNVDADGVVSEIPILIDYKGRLLPSFALQMVIKTKNSNLRKLKLGRDGGEVGGLRINDLDIPTDRSYRMLFANNSPGSKLETFSFVDVMNDEVTLKQIKNAIVLLGITGGEYTRIYRSPAGDRISEVELFGNVLANILSPRHLSRPGWTLPLEILAVLYFSFFLIFIIPRVNLKVSGLILIIFLISWTGASLVLFWVNGYWVKIFSPVVLAICGYGLLGFKSLASKKRYEMVAANKTLGLSFQGQGMLDMALERFMQCPVEDKSVKNLLYNLGLDFERKRMANKALAIYEHIRKAGNFKDLKKRIKKLKSKGSARPVSTTNGYGGTTLSMDDTDTHPTLGRYELLSELGRGAMGTVFLGRDPRINREVAVKTLPYTEIETNELDDVKTRFFREAEAAGRLSHPNIVSIYDAGEEHDMAYIAMELLEGHDLTAYCRKDNLLPLERVLEIISAVASALEYSHREGVVHRDIKPSNIMIVKDNTVKVTDFGIARVIDTSQTRTGVTLGTPSYMSPEQIAGKKVDGRSDLFSLGIVFYELLTGQKPFAADSITAILYAITHSSYPPLSKAAERTPPTCVAIVDKLLKKGLTKRFASASQVLKAIKICQAKL